MFSIGTEHIYIHYVICTGKPSRSSDDPDFVPTIFQYTLNEPKYIQDEQKVARKRRCLENASVMLKKYILEVSAPVLCK